MRGESESQNDIDCHQGQIIAQITPTIEMRWAILDGYWMVFHGIGCPNLGLRSCVILLTIQNCRVRWSDVFFEDYGKGYLVW